MTDYRHLLAVFVSIFLLAIFISLPNILLVDHSDRSYKKGQAVELWADYVGQHHNPQETYPYHSLPFCASDSPIRWNQKKVHTLGEKVTGADLRYAGYDIQFGENRIYSCTTKPFTREAASLFDDFAKDNGFYQMYLDDLPMWGIIGEELHSDLLVVSRIYTKRDLIIFTNPKTNQIVRVDLSCDYNSLVEIHEGDAYAFQFRVRFEDSDQDFDHRFDRYLDVRLYGTRWKVVIYSSVVLALLLYLLKKLDLRESLKKELMEEKSDQEKSLLDENDKSHSHQDIIFGEPDNVSLLAACVGSGAQLVLVITLMCLWEYMDGIRFLRGGIFTMFWSWLLLSSCIGGYVVAKTIQLYGDSKRRWLYEQELELFEQELQLSPNDETESNENDTDRMIKSDNVFASSSFRISVGLVAILLPSFHLLIVLVLSMLSSVQGTTRSLDLVTFIQLCWPWAVISVPLCLLGAAVGHQRISRNVRSHESRSSRPSSEASWHSRPMVLMTITGLVNFIPIGGELGYIFPSIWNYKFYVASGGVFVLLAIAVLTVFLTSTIAVACTLKTGENNQWHWTAFGCGASVSVYVFFYGVYYYWFATQMTGWYQSSYFLGVLVMISGDVGLLFGAIGFWAGHHLVHSVFQEKSV